jgi:hypothetical protein
MYPYLSPPFDCYLSALKDRRLDTQFLDCKLIAYLHLTNIIEIVSTDMTPQDQLEQTLDIAH